MNPTLSGKSRTVAILFIVAIALAAAAGYALSQHRMADGTSKTDTLMSAQHAEPSDKTVLYWYDPMVPGQKFDKPGKSPFMDMQLVPKYKSQQDETNVESMHASSVSIPSQTAQNLGIRLAKVELAEFGDDLMAVGRIQADERKFSVIQTRVSGYVEKLYVRAVGDPVRKGQKLAEIYAPELLAAQQEYLALLDFETGSQNGSERGNAGAAVTDGLAQAAHNRLKLMGMPEGEIAVITKQRRPSARFGIYAGNSGVVTELAVREGGQLQPGSSLMQITDLSSVWLLAEVPERDAARAVLGAPAELVLQGLPNQVFKGKVGYVYPALDVISRSLQVRVELPNRDGKLRPGMYGNVNLAGLRYEALAVPTESVIVTGQRKVVIVRENQGLRQGFRPVAVETGQEQGNRIEIIKGLSRGEEVVVSGQFLIDSEAALSGVLARLSQHSNMQYTAKPQQELAAGKGEVLQVNANIGEITLSHEPIPQLGWPAMTMSFKVSTNGLSNSQSNSQSKPQARSTQPSSSPLSHLKPGDQVQFELIPTADGEYSISHIEKQLAGNTTQMQGSPSKSAIKQAQP